MALKISKGWLLSIVLAVIRPLIKLVTPDIEKSMEKFVKDLYVKAQDTPNVFDDMFVEFIAELLDVEL